MIQMVKGHLYSLVELKKINILFNLIYYLLFFIPKNVFCSCNAVGQCNNTFYPSSLLWYIHIYSSKVIQHVPRTLALCSATPTYGINNSMSHDY